MRLLLLAPLALACGAAVGVIVLSVELIDVLEPAHQEANRNGKRFGV